METDPVPPFKAVVVTPKPPWANPFRASAEVSVCQASAMYWLYLWRSLERGWVDVDELAALASDPRAYAEACTELHDALVCKVLGGAIDYACGVGAAEPAPSLPDDCSASFAELLLAQLQERREARELVRRWVLSRCSVVERLLLSTTVEFPPPADVLPVWTSGPPLPDPASSGAW